MLRRDPTSPLFPYTTLFRSAAQLTAIRTRLAALLAAEGDQAGIEVHQEADRKSTRLNSSHLGISYAVFCLKKKNSTTAVPRHAHDKLGRQDLAEYLQARSDT